MLEASFQGRKQRLVSVPVITVLESLEGYVISDTSKKGLECVLMQYGKFVAYASRQLKDLSKLPYLSLRVNRGGVCT